MTDEEKTEFASYIQKEANGCWIWKGYFHPSNGRPNPTPTFGQMSVRRILFCALKKIPITSRVRVRNTCGHFDCVSPHHVVGHITERKLTAKQVAAEILELIETGTKAEHPLAMLDFARHLTRTIREKYLAA